MPANARPIWAVASLLLLSACSGKIGGSATPEPSATTGVSGKLVDQLPADPEQRSAEVAGSGAGFVPPVDRAEALPGESGAAPPPINVVTCTTPAVGPSPLRRLTHREYDNSVRDLLGVSVRPGAAFAPDVQVGLFDNTASAQTVSVLLADQYLHAAESVALAVDLEVLLGCDPSGSDGDACVRGFIARFVERATRRSPTDPELERLWELFSGQRSAAGPRTGVRAVIAAVLASPDFLFRPEQGGPPSSMPNARKLTSHELAARLASLLWASVPDDELLASAASDGLQDPTELERQARRMLRDERARPALLDFYTQWFGLSLLDSATKDPVVYPDFDDDLRASMAEETRRFVKHVLWQDDARLATLLTAPYGFVDGALAALYGVEAPDDPTSFAKTPLDSDQRRGLLSQASLMTAFASPSESSPIKRGKWVRVRMLCQDLPDPPADVPSLPEPEPGVSTRERFAMHTDHPACSGCHRLIDGLGFGLEHYNGIGAYRTMDHGAEVDASGEINTTRDIDGDYHGGPELAGLLAGSEQVRDCAPTQWLRYALGRREAEEDHCSLLALQEAFAASDGDLRELMISLVQTDAFQHYRAPE